MTYQCSDEPAKADTPIKGTENDESGSPLVITCLKWGHYQLVETNPKDGYAIVDSDGNAKIGYSVNFEMEKDGTVTIPEESQLKDNSG